jgi:FimV-like protein
LNELEIDGDYDEAQTQYELAKVFVDLDDEDGARKILNDLIVNDKISADVMSAAQKLLDSL